MLYISKARKMSYAIILFLREVGGEGGGGGGGGGKGGSGVGGEFSPFQTSTRLDLVN